MKHVYVISFHKNFEQLKRLVAALEFENTFFVIHVCKSYAGFEDIRKYFAGRDNITFCKRVRGVWGTYYVGRAQFNAILEAVNTFGPFDFLTTLSGQDYPIKSNLHIQSFLSANIGKEFMETQPIPPPLNKEGKYLHPINHFWTDRNLSNRYEFYYQKIYGHHYIRIPGELAPENSLKDKLGNLVKGLMGKIIPRRKFLKDHSPFLGPNWFSISYDVARYMEKQYARNNAFHNYMKKVYSASEMMFATILLNSPFKNRVVNDTLREIIWNEGAPNPIYLTKEHYQRLAAQGPSKLFARKFDLNVDSTILDLLDEFRK
jgi:hypothetical protein